jgi:NAD(P)H-dependent flavin oxidoreductase YrpB (nitropropane dioxygenase family)
MISTHLTRMLGIRHPVVQAGMGGVARADLVAAVSNAGGLGMLGMIRMAPDFIREQIRRTRMLTDRPFGVNLVPPVAPHSGFKAQLQVCLEETVPVVSLFWCDPAPFMERCRAAGVVVMLQIGSVEEARRAAANGVDVIVAQGVEAGGHVRGQVGLLSLLPSVVEGVSPVPVIAAGGIVDGRGLAAALTLGAEGVWVGTRFVASEEAEAHPDYKKRLLGASEADAVFTEIFHVGWPPGSPHRVLRNLLTDGGSPPPGPVARMRFGSQTLEVPPFGSATPTVHTEGRTELMANYAGQGVGLIHSILPAAEIVERMVSEAEVIMRRLPAMLG